jgi:hypothetical protein
MNILRLMGQAGLHGPNTPVRHPAKRRRIKTVIQELVYRAGRLINRGRQMILGLGANDRAAQAFIGLHGQFAVSVRPTHLELRLASLKDRVHEGSLRGHDGKRQGSQTAALR